MNIFFCRVGSRCFKKTCVTRWAANFLGFPDCDILHSFDDAPHTCVQVRNPRWEPTITNIYLKVSTTNFFFFSRTNWKSRLLQRKITNPIYLQLSRPEDLVVKKKQDIHVKLPRQKSSPSPETEIQAIEERKKQHVVFAEERSTPLRRMSRAISDVIMKKIAWTRSSVTKSESTCLLQNLDQRLCDNDQIQLGITQAWNGKWKVEPR